VGVTIGAVHNPQYGPVKKGGTIRKQRTNDSIMSQAHEDFMNLNLVMIDPTDDGVLEDLAKKSIRPGEEALMLAVLKSATEDFQEYVNARERKAKQLFCEAEEWFLDETSDSLFSFENICEILRIKPSYFRKGLLRWKEAHRTPLIGNAA
jgi:hypothetical protein